VGSFDRASGRTSSDGPVAPRDPQRVLKPDGTLWVTGTHHIIFSLGFALQWLGFRIINQIAWQKPDPVPDTLNTAFSHAEGTRKLVSDTTSPGS
jgi:hypothetical protein